MVTELSKVAQWYLTFLSRYPRFWIQMRVVVEGLLEPPSRGCLMNEALPHQSSLSSLSRGPNVKSPGAQFRPISSDLRGRCCWRGAEFRARSNEIYKSPRKLRACDWSPLFVVTRYTTMPATARERDASGAACAAGCWSRRCTREPEESRNRVHLSDIRSILQT